MTHPDPAPIRNIIRAQEIADEADIIAALVAEAEIPATTRAAIVARATGLVRQVRAAGKPGMMESFLAEYGLSTDEGIALMCLAEALLRVPDAHTIDALIEDKIAPSSWGAHLGKSSSSLVNASTWALMLTGRVLNDEDSRGVPGVLHGLVKRMGEPVIRTAVRQAMKELGRQFVLGRTIAEAVERGAAPARDGMTYSYDMLGEAAMTAEDAARYFESYANAISALGKHSQSDDIRDNPGISIKLSALHPRYEVAQRARVMRELVERVRTLAIMARERRMGLNIDAEEADRLGLSLDVIEAVLESPELSGWDGFGVVVQAYGKRAAPVLDWLYTTARRLDRRLMVRLVKGAYWDTEIKRAQVAGLADYPVFTRKSATDVSYLCCAARLLGMTDRIYPQFATHNAHTIAAILEMAQDGQPYEFQRLHGMGETLHTRVRADHGTRCRVYAPVGAHRDLLAYLVRRLLENGANSSFVNQIVDESVPPEVIATCPFDRLAAEGGGRNTAIPLPADIFGAGRINARGWDLRSDTDLALIEAARAPYADHRWQVAPLMAVAALGGTPGQIENPAVPGDIVADVTEAAPEDVGAALDAARAWTSADAAARAQVLCRAADLYEDNFGQFFALLAREAGKTRADAVSELREAVDFLRYYAAEGQRLADAAPRGIFACISPWNFPLAIFTGQIAAALAAGNAVLAKPAEPAPATAHLAVQLLHRAGVPLTALQFLPGQGRIVGAALASDPRVGGVCFTGSTATAQQINRAMAENLAPDAPLIAETGGLNAMIVDSTALPEQAVRDIVQSAFQSAGQRCSALRVLYVQEDIAPTLMAMLFGAMDQLRPGNPWHLHTDTGPVITETARRDIARYVETARASGRVLKELASPPEGHFVGPVAIRVNGIPDLDREVFGPVLHIATFRAKNLPRVLQDINASGYGLTFGLHTRIDDRVEQITSALRVGNMYVNRNQIGAVVGSQPFGGEGLSGTGPKAGGPHYLPRFASAPTPGLAAVPGAPVEMADVQGRIDALNSKLNRTLCLHSQDMPGPTGESNRLSLVPRGVVLCLGPDAASAARQAEVARAQGCAALVIAPGASGPDAIDGYLPRTALGQLQGFDLVALFSDPDDLRAARQALARRDGPLIGLVASDDLAPRCVIERHVCVDTTAAGGNASLLAATA